MELIEFKNKSVTELKELMQKLNGELHANRLKAATRELKQVHVIKNTRRTIARIQTLLQSKLTGSVKDVK